MSHVVTALQIATAAVVSGMLSFSVFAEDTIKIGVVTFLSGPAAGPFGVPAKSSAEMMVCAVNHLWL